MKALFWLGLVLGLAGGIGAGGWYPWVHHDRPPSRTEVVPNGGRAERFLIHLPADRIAPARELGAEPEPGTALVLVEQFKLRDAEGEIVGLAARHLSPLDAGGAGVAWLVTIPGRGTLMLADSAGSPARVDAALAAQGHTRGAAWEGNATVEVLGRGAGNGQFSAGTDEFAGLGVSFTEIWSLTGADADGRLRGTIELATVGRRGT